MDCIGFSRFETGRHGRWLVAWLLLCPLAWTLAAAPPTPPRRTVPARPRPAPDGQRFLFVVDISSAMRDTDAANRQALFDMLFTGLDGQMRSGDTFGLWFYNDKLHAGAFPMQIWDEKDSLAVASLATKFLRDQAYSGRSRPDVLMPPLLNIIKNVRDVNVLVISHGKPALEGTPFDTNITAIVRRKRSEREAAQKPFITALAARGGSIVGGGVIIAGETIPLPARPPAVLAAKGTNSLARPTNSTATLNSIPSASGQAVNSEPGTRNPELPPQATVSLAPQTAAPPKPKVLQFVTRPDAAATNVAAAPASTPEKSISSSESSKPSTEFRVPSSELLRTGIEPEILNPDPGTAIVNSEPGTRNPEPRQHLNADATPTKPVPATVASLAESLDSKPVAVAARSPAANGPSAAPALLETPTPGPSAALLLTIGIVLLAACLGLLLLVLRKLRPRRETSFITQSMESR
ncbi:MAG TPA: hypothetical protein VFT34_04800 [Verrucomicrobiae bacterium]|nr:hypothetical protein [Verrucomicrobiae bacterium]